MLKPNRVPPNGRVALYNPSDPLLEYRVDFIRRGIETIRAWGFSINDLDHKKVETWSTLQNPAVRAAEIHSLMRDDSVHFLLASWGGKICIDLLPLLDYELLSRAPKPILGVSDIGVLLNAISYKSSLITFYGPNIAGKLHQTAEIGFPLITSPTKEVVGQHLLASNVEARVVRSGSCEGQLVGGSLGTFTLGLSGTPYFPRFGKIILFWESGSLNVWGIKQHLQHLRLVGDLSNVVGVLVGATTKLKAESDYQVLDHVLLEVFNNTSIPILRGDFLGHGDFPNRTLPIGAKVRLSTDIKNMTLLEPVTKDEKKERIASRIARVSQTGSH